MDARQKTLNQELRRGEILRILVVWGMKWMPVKVLLHQLALSGIHISMAELEFHLDYLANESFLLIQRLRDTPHYRPERAGQGDPETVIAIKLTNAGLNFYDGRGSGDKGVRF